MSKEEHDDQVIRCLRIGDFVPFKYCRTSGAPFCHLLIQCWAPRLDIGRHLAENYTPEEIQQGLNRPAGGKIGRMVEIAKKYRPEK